MVGEFTTTGGNIQNDKIKQDLGVDSNIPAPDAEQQTNAPDGKFKTDVDGIFADGQKGGLPVFDVEQDEFFKNMKQDRKRMRFNTGSTAQKYHSNTKYANPFWIRNKKDGYVYRIDRQHDKKISMNKS